MEIGERKPGPRSGMNVTWLDQEEAGEMADAISYFASKYGTENLKVLSITNSVGETVNRVVVTLTKNGIEIQGEWDEKVQGPKPFDFRPQRIWINWNLLKIVE